MWAAKNPLINKVQLSKKQLLNKYAVLIMGSFARTGLPPLVNAQDAGFRIPLRSLQKILAVFA